jgi:hypothetical protein
MSTEPTAASTASPAPVPSGAPPPAPSAPKARPGSPIATNWYDAPPGDAPTDTAGEGGPAADVLKVGEREVSRAELAAFLKTRDDAGENAPQLPAAAAADFVVELPADFRLPEGLDFELDPAHPDVTLAREVALDAGLSQPQFSKMLGLHATIEARKEQHIQQQLGAELQALGGDGVGPDRVAAVTQGLRGLVGDEGAMALVSNMITRRQVSAYETLLRKVTSQGAGSFSQSHRADPEPPPQTLAERWYPTMRRAPR